MNDEYENALRTIATAYENEVASYGGRSLSRVASIVVNSGSFFQRLRDGKPFLVHNLERFAAWFRDPTNWPNHEIPQVAIVALASIGRPPEITSSTLICRNADARVASNAASVFDRKRA